MAKSRGFWEIEWGEVPSPHLLMAATWGTYKVLMAFLHFYINLVQLYKYVWPNWISERLSTVWVVGEVKTNEVSLMRSLSKDKKKWLSPSAAAWRPHLWPKIHFAICTNKFCDLHKYILQFAQINFLICTNKFCDLHK